MYASYILLLVLAILLSWAIAAEIFRRIVARAFRGMPAPSDRPSSADGMLDYAPPEIKGAWMRGHLWVPAVVAVLFVILLWAPLVLIAGAVRYRLPDMPLPNTLLFVGMSVACTALGAATVVSRGMRRDAYLVPMAVSWRWRRPWLALAACVVAMMVVILITDRLIDRRLDAQREQAKAAVVAMTAEPGDAAPAALYIEAEALWKQNEQALAWLNAPDRAPEPPPFSVELADVVKLVGRAANAEKVDFGVDRSVNGILAQMPHLVRLRMLANIVGWHAVDRARAGDWDAAMADIRALHGMSRQCSHGVIEMLVAVGIEQLAVSKAEQCLSFAQSEAQLAKLSLTDTRWYGELAQHAVQGEDATMRWAVADILQGKLGPGGVVPRFAPMRMLLAPAEMDDLDEIYSAARTAAEHSGDALIPDPLTPPFRTRGMLVSMLRSSLDRAISTMVEARIKRQNLELAIAATRYRLRTGTLPADLEALVEAGLLPSIPLDPWDGKPWRFVHRGDHVLIYSIGRDRTDNGGADGSVNPKALDNIVRVSNKPLWLFEKQPEVEPADSAGEE